MCITWCKLRLYEEVRLLEARRDKNGRNMKKYDLTSRHGVLTLRPGDAKKYMPRCRNIRALTSRHQGHSCQRRCPSCCDMAPARRDVACVQKDFALHVAM